MDDKSVANRVETLLGLGCIALAVGIYQSTHGEMEWALLMLSTGLLPVLMLLMWRVAHEQVTCELVVEIFQEALACLVSWLPRPTQINGGVSRNDLV